ncbi:TPA: hypothetical protein SE751_001204 [Campylobacter jejuni]|uniref:gluconate 2-dehydrogenase subunit 3 family protein n=1 Tax=Campylobacter jejuni TaxID=197 RepID=UPI001436A259|nr:gluconate 2-dehydrogenase subunit 3 family protein [Campylobacter jejuni]EHZ4950497.1 hypothetical protein [Campylobacter jejuni]EIC6055858.1 hypothetical protein [Campylobacter jejuni]EIF7499855.1 hypothetical protein [Campylobacter jejuni]EIN8293702.1 hypothetical protein [Campylobacter jejuni]EIQ6567623.1 hypothetical protein [Campylobacter jejuni]
MFALVGASAPSMVFAHTHNQNNLNSIQIDILSEAVERIFPKDDLGPGAKN